MKLEPVENLPTFLEKYFHRDGRDIIPSHLAKILLALVGAKTENRDISCGILVPSPGNIPDLAQYGSVIGLPSSFPSELVIPWAPGEGVHYASHIRRLRDTLGRVGDAVELVAVVGNQGQNERLLLLNDGMSLEQLSREGDVAFVGPNRVLWTYCDGKKRCQVIWLRDGTGWAVRDIVENDLRFQQIFGVDWPLDEAGRAVLDSTYRASEQGTGLAIILSNCDFELYRRELHNDSGAVAKSIGLQRPIVFSSAREILRLASLDGATLLSAGADSAVMIDAGVYFVAPGGRHKSTAFIVNHLPWVYGAIVVSEDGPISWFRKGEEQPVGGDLVRFL